MTYTFQSFKVKSMNSVTKKLVLLISITSVLIGIILIIFQLNIVSNDLSYIFEIIVKLWPVALILGGIIFLRDAISRRFYLNRYELKEKSLHIPLPQNIQEVQFGISFSFGNFSIKSSSKPQNLLCYDQYGPMPEPMIETQEIGRASIVKLNKSKPYFSPHFRIENSWALELSKSVPFRFDIDIIESNISLDFNNLDIEELILHATSGIHKIIFGRQKRKVFASIYSSSTQLILSVPAKSFVRLNLKNPFCKLEYPQGDFIKNEEGTFISTISKNDFCQIELMVDGPIKHLVLDIAE